MKIEEVSKDDVDELKELARSSILETVEAREDIKVEIIADTMAHIEMNMLGTERVFLKCYSSTILGFIIIQNYWNLSDLFVLPKSHGKGVGHKLFAAAREICVANQDKGYIRVNSSLNAEGFYRAIGFEMFTPDKEVPNFVVPLIYHF